MNCDCSLFSCEEAAEVPWFPRIGLCRFFWHGESSRIFFSEFSSWIFSLLPSGIFPLRHALHSILCRAARKRQRFRDSRGSASAASSDTGRVSAFSLNSPCGFSLCCPRGFSAQTRSPQYSLFSCKEAAEVPWFPRLGLCRDLPLLHVLSGRLLSQHFSLLQQERGRHFNQSCCQKVRVWTIKKGERELIPFIRGDQGEGMGLLE